MDAVSAIAVTAALVVCFSRDAWRLSFGSEFRRIRPGQWADLSRAALVARRCDRACVNKMRASHARERAARELSRALPAGHVLAWRDMEGAHFSGIHSTKQYGRRTREMLTIKEGTYYITSGVAMVVFLDRVAGGGVWISRRPLPPRVQTQWVCAAAQRRPAGFAPIAGCGVRFRTVGSKGTILNTVHPFLAALGIGALGHVRVGVLVGLGIWIYMDFSLRVPRQSFLFARERLESRARWRRFRRVGRP